MRALICGYGRMGREVERVLVQRGHTISARVDPREPADAPALTEPLLRDAHVVIDFSHPTAVADNVRACLRAGVPVVVGTTGWEQERDDLRALCQQLEGSVVWGNNFSVGAHLFFRLAAEAARLVRDLEDYDVAIWEAHHHRKADAPSGTALTAAERILDNLGRKREILKGNPQGGPIAAHQLHVASIRVGSEVGLHEVILDSPQDQITLRHHARGRQGFALGAVLAAEWVLGRKGFFSVEEFVSERYFGTAQPTH